MSRKIKTIGEVSLSKLEDEWQRQATSAAIAAIRDLVKPDGPIPPLTPVGRLADGELGWIVAAVLFAWISKRAEQATSEEIDTERVIRLVALDVQAWDAGAAASVLPDLVNECADIDWGKPLAEWPKDMVIEFLLKAMRLIRRAMIARDQNDRGITRKSSASTISRQANAAAGGPLMTPDEFSDEIGI